MKPEFSDAELRVGLPERSFRDAVLGFWRDEEGATITEYILLVVFIGMSAVTLIRVMPRALRAYMGYILYVLSLPIP